MQEAFITIMIETVMSKREHYPSTLRRRLRPLQLAVLLQGVLLWVPIEKLFMSEIGFDPAAGGDEVVVADVVPAGHRCGAGSNCDTGSALRFGFGVQDVPAVAEQFAHNRVRSPDFLQAQNVHVALRQPGFHAALVGGPDAIDIDGGDPQFLPYRDACSACCSTGFLNDALGCQTHSTTLPKPAAQLTTVPVTGPSPSFLRIMPRPLWAVTSMVSSARSTMPSSLPR